MDPRVRKGGSWHALPGTFRALGVVLVVRLLAWCGLAGVGLYCFFNGQTQLSESLWKLAGTAGPPPTTTDAYTVGKLAVLLGGPLVFHIIVLACLALRSRWATNVLVTIWAAVAIVGAHPAVDGLLCIPAWLLLVAPPTQRFLARNSNVDVSNARRLSWAERARVVGYSMLSGLLPGLGQLLHRRWKRAAAIFVPWSLAAVAHLEPVWVLLVLYALSDAGWMTVERIHATEAEGIQPA